MTDKDLKRTPLYDIHRASGGKMMPFAGWDMPIQYKTGVIKEHMAVREKCGIFDVSHMGEIFCRGEDALKALNYLMTNDFSNMKIGACRYTLICNEKGGVVDDVIVYKLGEEEYMLVSNAANEEKDYNWLTEHNKFDKADFINRSEEFGQIALQGPLAEEILGKIASPSDLPEKNYTFKNGVDIKGISCLVSRTGYTGEDGFEIYTPVDKTPDVWEALIDAGKDKGLLPCGLGARDTLRLEAGMPLYGNEMDESVMPKEAGLSFCVKMDKDDFLGKTAIESPNSAKRRKVGLVVTGRGIIRENMDVYLDGEKIGRTTSGTKCPYINKSVAVALVDADKKKLGTTVQVDVRGRKVDAEMTKSKFYERGKKNEKM